MRHKKRFKSVKYNHENYEFRKTTQDRCKQKTKTIFVVAGEARNDKLHLIVGIR